MAANSPPPIDSRTTKKITDQVTGSIQQHTDWQPDPLDSITQQPQGISTAIIGVFARFTELIIQRLNQVPNKNFLAFLDLLGASRLPPQAARVPLTFSLATGSTVDAIVPAGTQAAAPPPEGKKDPVIFETERNLTVTPAQLKAVCVRNQDKYGDYTEIATGRESSSFMTFEGNQAIEHSLYLACDPLFTMPAPKAVTVTIDADRDNIKALASLSLNWTYCNGHDQLLQPQLNIRNGLEVTLGQDKRSIEISSGEAIDVNNKLIHLESSNYPFVSEYLEKTKGKTVLLTIFDNKNDRNKLLCHFLEDEANQYPSGTYIRLARLGIKTDGTIEIKSLSWSGSIANFPVPTKRSVNNQEAAWLKIQLKDSLSLSSSLPKIQRIIASAHVDHQGIQPELGFTNGVPLDLSKDFLPFGVQPTIGDTFYLASSEVFAHKGTRVKIHVVLNPESMNSNSSLQVFWEVNNGYTWNPLNVQGNPEQVVHLQMTGDITFTLSEAISSSEVNGKTNYWIRARISQISYGSSSAYAQAPTFTTLTQPSSNTDNRGKLFVQSVRGFMPGDLIQIALGTDKQEADNISEVNSVDINNQFITLRNSLKKIPHPIGTTIWYIPLSTNTIPIIEKLILDYTYDAEQPLSGCLTCNDFNYQNYTEAANTGNAPFQPFERPNLDEHTLYLGFDRPFTPHRSITLYAQVEPPAYNPLAATPTTDTVTASLRLKWEYRSPQGWLPLSVQDETRGLTERGLITFISPEDFAQEAQFGYEPLYWLRVIQQDGSNPPFPKLRRLLTNTTWANQHTTLRNEILGSSNGTESQQFRTTQTPVLQGQQLEVREAEKPSDAERQVIEQEEGNDAIVPVNPDTPAAKEVWVRWHAVADFYASGARDRHYRIEPLTGEIQFGNGINGMIPPLGASNIRLSRYQTGGGTQGNRPAGSITQLKTTVPYVAAVTNLEAAAGGAEAESLKSLRDRMPRTVRHYNRAVTVEDYEDLAKLASPEVARAKCIPLYNLQTDPLNLVQKPGAVSVIIVPQSTDPPSLPSLELIRRVQDYLVAHSLPGINISVVGPLYLEVSLTVKIALTTPESASTVEQAVNQTLTRFLHPLMGGFERQGWTFGREPHDSDFYRLIEGVPGVDHVISLTVDDGTGASDSNNIAIKNTGRFLVYSGQHHITPSFGGAGG
ncbi:putative baseplate assembly protein [Pantanalinema rosaneae CENA516]|uniref:putative baseplate assembly protein n=1 Tax=Pantanalinema rosaneae TaxID=1620701 RepID=UPI003D6F313A